MERPFSSPAAADDFPIDRLREETPGCLRSAHLNNAGASLLPRPVLDAVSRYQALEAETGGYEAAALERAAIRAAHEDVAALIGARTRNVALVENATVAFAQALSSIPFEPGDHILTTTADYASNQIMFLSLARRLGVMVDRIPDLPEGGADPEAAEEILERRRPRLVALTHIPSFSGLVQPVEEIVARCHRREILTLVDACQSVGQLPVDAEAMGCDFLSATGRKFLRGPRGTGFLYVSDRALELGLEPLLPDLRGAEWSGPETYRSFADARRFENWEFNYGLVLGLGAAAKYARQIGLEALSHRTQALAEHARAVLDRIEGIRRLDRGERLAAIVTLVVGSRGPEEVVAELRRRGVHTSAVAPSNALLSSDWQDGALRISPHYFNTRREIESLGEHLEEMTSDRRSDRSVKRS